MYLDGFGKFSVIFVQKLLFLPLSKTKLGQKSVFRQILKNTIF